MLELSISFLIIILSLTALYFLHTSFTNFSEYKRVVRKPDDIVIIPLKTENVVVLSTITSMVIIIVIIDSLILLRHYLYICVLEIIKL